MINDDINGIKKSFGEMGIKYEKDEEYIEAWHNLVGYFDVLIQLDLDQKRKQTGSEKTSEKRLINP